ncbi:hypothetical protein ACTVJF_20390, partial [Stenotrophomonas maltophilia]|uniref:hypothetical protein n=1 Tax=Stenotrophomonas maltophilia TaxID=40324 RepID=UPI003FA6F223
RCKDSPRAARKSSAPLIEVTARPGQPLGMAPVTFLRGPPRNGKKKIKGNSGSRAALARVEPSPRSACRCPCEKQLAAGLLLQDQGQAVETTEVSSPDKICSCRSDDRRVISIE